MDVLLQHTHHLRAVQLLVVGVCGYDDTVARHPIPAPIGLLLYPLGVPLLLSVSPHYLLITLTYFYARKEWKTYSKFNLWTIFIIDVIIASLYNLDIYLEPKDQYTDFMLTEIWIRPTITYGIVACFVTESKRTSK